MADTFPTEREVTEAQRRLSQLGHDPFGDVTGVLGANTAVALQAFQRERGLAITGALDEVTWRRLLEAAWVLGDRLLYLDRPFQRGDDVAALQESLAKLGFNPGRIDGIFGPLTERALADFQRNCGDASSGVLNRASLQQLSRLSARPRR
jgi:N-acetylmuramoyl-L-alanine amidase